MHVPSYDENIWLKQLEMCCCVAVFVNYGLLFVSPTWVCELLGLLQPWKPAGHWNRTETQDGGKT